MKYLLLTIFTLLCLIGFSQNEFPPIVNYSTHDYDKSKSRNPENVSVAQDNQGVMYFGNSNGVITYDGESWRFILVQNGSFVQSMAVDSNGTVYAGTYGEFGYFDTNDQGDRVFKSLMKELPEEDQWFSTIWYIYTTKEDVFFMAQESLFIYNIESGSLSTVYPDDSYHTSYLVNSTLYLRERQKGIVSYNNGEISTLPGTDLFLDMGVFGIYEGDSDTLIIVTQEIGLYKYANGQLIAFPDEVSVPLIELGIFGSHELSDGTIALLTFANGLVIINKQGEIINHLTRGNGLRSDETKAVYEDKHNNLWVALGNGISKVNYFSPLSYLDRQNGFEGNVQAIIRFKENLYIGTSYGLFKEINTADNRKKFLNTGAVNNQVWDFTIANEKLYVASSEGILETSNGEDFKFITLENANAIYFDEDQDLFFQAGSHGVTVSDKNFNTVWYYEGSYSRFLGIEKDPIIENTIWFGTANSGILRVRNSEGEFVLDQYYEPDGIPDDNLIVPILWKDELLFGTSQGTHRFITEDEMVVEVEDSLKKDPDYYRGMFTDEYFHDSLVKGQILLIQANENRTWYSIEHELGYYHYQLDKFVNTPFKAVDFGRMNTMYLEDNGTLWAGYADGLIRYKETTRKTYEQPFNALIREVILNGDSTIFYGVRNEKTSSIGQSIDYKQGSLEFFFAATYYEDAHKNLYSHMLEGHDDDDWSPWTFRTETNYTNLPEGTYTFKVKAKNIYGQISELDEFTFTINPPWYRTAWAYTLYVIAFVFVLFVGVRISSIRLKKKNQWLEGVVEERTREIQDKNKVLQEQKKEIEDSINYAQRIQQAILPLEEEMKKWIPEAFVLFRPKDIVSGDFYWFMEKDGKLIFICADCTGHGVPGAFMSMIGSDRLNIIVAERKITSPSQILSELNRAIKMSLKQDGQKDSTKDGMDAAICTIDTKTKKLMYAGANRPLWIVKNDIISEIKATKVAVAGFTDDDQVYEEHVLDLEEGMRFYMSSDGYADQFGGQFEKKFKVKNMKSLILRIQDKDFQEQRNVLESEIVNWMGEVEQIDDICVVGFEPKLQ
ncbi:MAG: SpoIIE family protein phosphatase [Crocinitomicaceae bacterium]|nr:SpoIIE family protein phosphatase [Crocinitomicaceae bacterium]